MNVLKKIVIPRTNVTAQYILSELEELAREEFHRLKKVKEKKKRDSKKKHDHVKGNICPICDKRMDVKPKVVIENELDYFLNAKPTKTEPKIQIPKYILPKPPELVQLKDSYRNLSPIASTTQPATCSIASTCATGVLDIENRLDYIRRRITNIITISKDFIEMGIDTFDAHEFLRICEGAKNRLERFFEIEQTLSEQNDTKDELSCLKCYLRDAVDVTKEIKEEGLVSSSIDKFIKAWEVIDSKLNKTVPKVGEKHQTVQIEELKTNIDDVMQMAQDYEAEGLLTPGVEDFIKSCTIIKARLEGKPILKTQKDIDEEKLDHLKDHVSELEELTIKMEEQKITSTSVEKFVSSCKEFKKKIEEDREKLQERKALSELSHHIDRVVGVGKKAQAEGLLEESVEDFVKSIGDVKKDINQHEFAKDVEDSPEPDILNALKSHIDDVIKSVAKLRSGNIISVSVDKFLSSCEEAKARIDLYQRYSPVDFEKRAIIPICSDRCICGGENEDSKATCERCQNESDTLPFVEELPPPCASCDDNFKKKAPSSETVCVTCSQPIEEDILLPEPTPDISLECSNICEVCEGQMKESEPVEKDKIQGEVDSSLGYFEKKVRKITKVKRTLNSDGTIREEKETITVRTEKYDPNETSLLDDDENEEYNVSYESLLDDGDEKQIAVCSTPNQNQRGFLFLNGKAKSEMIFRVSPRPAPILRNCVSNELLLDFNDSYSIANDSISVELNVCSLYCNSNMIQQSPVSNDYDM